MQLMSYFVILPEFFRVGLVQTQLAQILFPFWELGGWEIVWGLVFMRLDELLLLAGLLEVEVDGVRVVGLEGAGVRAWLAGAGERGHGLLLPLPLPILCSLHLNIEHPKLQHWHHVIACASVSQCLRFHSYQSYLIVKCQLCHWSPSQLLTSQQRVAQDI